jgi:hypothetical protein
VSEPGAADLAVSLGEFRESANASAVVALSDWNAMAQGAFSPNTIRAWRADWEIFSAFCQRDTRMPMRYGERELAGRGAMARAAKAQGRL